MRRPTRPQRPALVASELIVLPPEPYCKLFFAYIFAFLCILPTVLRFCVVLRQLYCYATQRPFFFVWRCCSLCELNRRRRVKRFKRRLRLRLSVYTACVFARVFATLGGFILPSAVAVAVCAACLRCAAALPACICARARFLIYARGDRVLKVPRRGGGHLHVQF